MSDIGNLLSAITTLIVGFGIIAIVEGANASMVSSLISNGVIIVLLVGTAAAIVLSILQAI